MLLLQQGIGRLIASYRPLQHGVRAVMPSKRQLQHGITGGTRRDDRFNMASGREYLPNRWGVMEQGSRVMDRLKITLVPSGGNARKGRGGTSARTRIQ